MKNLNTAEEYNEEGAKHWQKGELKEAEKYFQKALELNPNIPSVLNNNGLLFFVTKEYEKAETMLRKAIELKPDYAEAYDNLGRSLYAQRRLEESAVCFRKAIEVKPNWQPASYNLGTTMMNLANLTEAVFYLEQAAKLDPKDMKALVNLGTALDKSGRTEEAIECYFKAIDIQPDFESGYFNIMSLMEQQHKLVDVQRLLDKAEEHIPNTQPLAIIKSRLAKRDKNYEGAIKELEAVKNQESMMTAELHFELGILYDRVEESDKAFAAFEEANKRRRESHRHANYNIDFFPAFSEELARPFTKEWVASWTETRPSARYEAPVFIVGFPRSGTTLTGQILHSHPSLFVAEELVAVERSRSFIAGTYPKRYPDCLATLGPGDIEKMRSIFYANHKNNAQWEARETLVDKHPLNLLKAGMIYRMFPDAKLIFVARHPCDCILSCFMQDFSINDAMVQFTSFEQSIKFYKLCMDIWQQFNDAIPDLKTHIIRYEDLIGNFNDEVEKMLGFIDVEWNDSVLEYNKNAKAKPRTITPSYSQITEPIYDRAKFRWHRYRKYFEPHLKDLKPYIEYFGYDVD